MREVPLKKRMDVLKLYLEGLAYDEIVKRVGVSKGSVVNIIMELKNGVYPEFESVLDVIDELRELATKLKKGGVSVSQAILGLKFYESLQAIGVEPQTLSDYIKFCKKVCPQNFPVDKFVNVAVRLCRLEEMLGKSYEEALNDLEGKLEKKSSTLNELNSKIEALEAKKTCLESELKKIEVELTSAKTKLAELIKGTESLKKLGIEKVCKLSTFGRECEELGYDVNKLIELVRLVDKKASLEKQISTLQNRITILNQEIKHVEREKMAMIAENRSLSTASKILRNRTTIMACVYCCKPIVVSIPNTWELDDSIKKRLVYLTKCHYCGYINQVSPHEILASIAWSILTA